MRKVEGFEVPPPGAGLKTVTAGVPVETMSLAEIWASAVLASTIVVGRSLPFQRTTEPATKLEPDTHKLKAGAPTGAPLGSRELILGTRFIAVVMVKFMALEMPPPGAGLVTVTAGVPADAMAAAGIAAVNCVALTNVVAGAAPPKLTIEAATKFVPVIVSVKATPPAGVVFGEIEVMVGVGLDPLGGGG